MNLFRTSWLLALVALMVILSACGDSGQDTLDWEVQPFDAVNQEGESVSLDDLKGDVWLTSFIFTNCVTVCPPMTANMAQLQQQLEDEGLTVPIVSFSVDPERDDPQALKAYGEEFNADFSSWQFLTGYSFEDIQHFSSESFKSLVQFEEDSDQVMHTTSFFLVNDSGVVVQKYNGIEPPYEEILNDIKSLR